MNKNYNYIDLFSGAGGFSLGFDRAGFKNIFSIDFDESFNLTYKFNFPNHLLIERDISQIKSKEIKSFYDGQDIDVIIGGPPCQGFSMAGNIGRTFIDDPRNHLFNDFAKFVSIIKPKSFVMENVQRLYNHNKGKTRNQIISLFKQVGYNVECKILNTVNFGVPQNRRRVIFIGNRLNNKIIFPKETKKIKSIKDAIDHFPKIKSGQSSSFPNHEAMNHTTQMLEKMSFIKDGEDRMVIPEDKRPKSGDIRKYIKYNSKLPSICITGDMRKVFHYNQNRALTVRELAAIQTFPDDFIFKGSKISQQQQIGNAVPPLFAECIAESIKEMIEGE